MIRIGMDLGYVARDPAEQVDGVARATYKRMPQRVDPPVVDAPGMFVVVGVLGFDEKQVANEAVVDA